jgi:hypothetical protein
VNPREFLTEAAIVAACVVTEAVIVYLVFAECTGGHLVLGGQ